METTGLDLIAKERQRQIDEEGWTADHDDKHSNEEIAHAAVCYAKPIPSEGFITAYWPWEREWYKPTPNDRVRELTKAGALIAAQIDVLLRREYEDGMRKAEQELEDMEP